ncbi:uncharacterized protein LOC125377945 [Haliotis rufescens]|uniref:uncharacterized protein LOC125377945 n=1 Tax=Haliotis rufescens TaxID=6454 RepID=UPI00201F5BE8|nr:uncharacterized protein LOC125377945 [Haliotis rufescens]
MAPIICTEKRGALGAMETLPCDEPVVARFVKIQRLPIFSAHLTICEVQVRGERCIAEAKSTTKSTNIKTIRGYMNVGPNSSTDITGSSLTTCAVTCLSEHRCYGFNFNRDSHRCELVTRMPSQIHVVSDQNWLHYGTMCIIYS